MRRISFILPLLFAACNQAPPGEMTNGAAAPAPGAPDNRIECRTGDAAAFDRVCTMESADGPGGRVLTIRKADGSFRRLRVTTDGHGVVAADGAERVRVTILEGGRIEAEIGGDRFRLPARVQRR